MEPNLLLAVSTGIGLALLILTATVYGAGDTLIRNALLAFICAATFVVTNPFLMRALRQPSRPPLIHASVRNALAWAAVFPLAIFVAALAPAAWPGHDYGLLIIIAALWFGVTVESALKAG